MAGKQCKNCKYKQMFEFIRPHKEEVVEYCKVIGYECLDVDYFLDYNASRGWLTPDQRPLKDWKAVVRIWMRNALKRGEIKPNTETKSFRERQEGI